MAFAKKVIESENGFFTVFPSLCKGCGLCMVKCPMKAIEWSDTLGIYGTPAVEINGNCIACGICQEFCPDCAIMVTRKMTGECMACGGCEWECKNGAIYVDEFTQYALDPGKCICCGDCFRACPTGAIIDKAESFLQREEEYF